MSWNPSKTTDTIVIDKIEDLEDYTSHKEKNVWKIFGNIIIDFRLGALTNKVIYSNRADITTIKVFTEEKEELFFLVINETYDKVKMPVKSKEQYDAHESLAQDIMSMLDFIFHYVYFHRVPISPVSKYVTKGNILGESSGNSGTVRIGKTYTLKNYPVSRTNVGVLRKADSWEVRGHPRHYKSGKTVFIKPYTKGLGDKKTKKYKL